MWNYTDGTNNMSIGSNMYWNSLGSSVCGNATSYGWQLSMGTKMDKFTVTRWTGATGAGTAFNTATTLLNIDNGGNLTVGGNVSAGTITGSIIPTTFTTFANIAGATVPSTGLIYTHNGSMFMCSSNTISIASYISSVSSADAIYNNPSYPNSGVLTLSNNIARLGTNTSYATVSTSGLTVSTLTNGAVYSNSSGLLNNSSSDATLKTNVNDITYGLNEILKMRGVSFNWIDTETRGDQNEIGFIAQEMKPIIPEIIGVNYDKTLSLDYAKLTSVLVKGIQELHYENQQLNTKVNLMEDFLKSKFPDFYL